ncbi:MAG: hypothetical protein ACX939_04020 [Hyphococcus sp.]
MGEGWLTQILTDRLFLAIGSFALGLATGWLVWFGGRINGGGHSGLKAPDAPAPDAEKLDALAAEIEKAAALLRQNEDDQVACQEALSDVDEAVKRANGRLKLMLKSIDRA